MNDIARFTRTGLPVSVRHRVGWGECDPAGVVYTPRFAEYVVLATEHFYEYLLDGSLQEKLRELDIGLPAKALSFEFKRSLWPDQQFDMTVRVGDIRDRTFDLQVVGTELGGKEVFVALFSPICIRSEVREACTIPPALKSLLMAYRSTFPTI